MNRLQPCNNNSQYAEKTKGMRKLVHHYPRSPLAVFKSAGKSSVMKQYRENKGVVYLTDCTAYGITRDVLPKIVSGEIKTIMIPDLLTPLSKQTKTRQSFRDELNSLFGIVARAEEKKI